MIGKIDFCQSLIEKMDKFDEHILVSSKQYDVLKKFMLSAVKVCYKCKNVAHVYDKKYYCATCRLNEQLSNNKIFGSPGTGKTTTLLDILEKKLQKDIIHYELDTFLLHVEQ
jgi:Cdc6-like AAA superfamily ATPase